MARTETRSSSRPAARGGALDRYFKITERGSTVRTELVAGLATWLTMAYILFVNPQILGAVQDGEGTSLSFPQVLTVTALVAGVVTVLMGVVATTRSPWPPAWGSTPSWPSCWWEPSA
jgi:AGZA family xanthine/uracil permease-like MFS transporter